MTKLNFYIFSVLIFWACNTLATDTAEVTEQCSFGTFTQLQSTAKISIGTDGNVAANGATSPASVKAGKIHYAAKHLWHLVTMPSASPVSSQKQECLITLGNQSYSPNSFNFDSSNIAGSSSKDVFVGADLEFSGFCPDGDYTITFDVIPTVSLYSITSVPMNCTFTITSPLDIKNKQNLNFGVMVSPTAQSLVSVSYNGQISQTGGIYLINKSTVAEGIFTVSGTQGRTVNVTLPTQVVLRNQTGKLLTVQQFNVNLGTSFVLENSDVDLAVGATLIVPANAPAGEYSGEYTITVSY